MTYEELKTMQQKEINNLPLGFCFSNEQFEEMMKEWGLTPQDTDKIYSLGNGCFYKRTDSQLIHDTFERHDKDLEEFMKDPKNMEDAFYNDWEGDYEVLRCFGKIKYRGDDLLYDEELKAYFEELGFSDSVKLAYFSARDRYNHASIENEWF